jgi:hypothetical protein
VFGLTAVRPISSTNSSLKTSCAGEETLRPLDVGSPRRGGLTVRTLSMRMRAVNQPKVLPARVAGTGGAIKQGAFGKALWRECFGRPRRLRSWELSIVTRLGAAQRVGGGPRYRRRKNIGVVNRAESILNLRRGIRRDAS